MKIIEKKRQKVGNGLFIPYFSPEILAPGKASGARAHAQASLRPIAVHPVWLVWLAPGGRRAFGESNRIFE